MKTIAIYYELLKKRQTRKVLLKESLTEIAESMQKSNSTYADSCIEKGRRLKWFSKFEKDPMKGVLFIAQYALKKKPELLTDWLCVVFVVAEMEHGTKEMKAGLIWYLLWETITDHRTQVTPLLEKAYGFFPSLYLV